MFKSNFFRVLFTTLSFIYSSSILWAQTEQEVEYLAEKILEAIDQTEKGNYDNALGIYDTLIEKYPAPMLYVLKGEVYTKFNERMSSDD